MRDGGTFRTQMEALQDGDRLYYLPRIEGMDYEESLQDSSLAQLVRANTGIAHLPGNMFLTPEYTVEAKDYYATTTDAAGRTTFVMSGGEHVWNTDAFTSPENTSMNSRKSTVRLR